MPYFNTYGRAIPNNLTKNPVNIDSRRYFKIKYETPPCLESIFRNISSHSLLAINTSFDSFKLQIESIIQSIQSNSEISPLLNGPYFPFIIPTISEKSDIGTVLNDLLLPALNSSFKASFPKYDFVNRCRDPLAGNLLAASDSKHECLLARVNNEEVVGCLFPALSEFSINAAFDFVNSLPQNFSLSGGYDLTSAFIGSPALLINKEEYPPLLWAAGIEHKSNKDHAYHFEAYGYNLNFNIRPHFNRCSEYWTNSITVLNES